MKNPVKKDEIEINLDEIAEEIFLMLAPNVRDYNFPTAQAI